MTSKKSLEKLLDNYEYLMKKYWPELITGLKEAHIKNTKEDVYKILQDLDSLEILEKENKRLKDYMADISKEFDKLEKAIAILRFRKPNLLKYFDDSELTIEEIELLKEVLND